MSDCQRELLGVKGTGVDKYPVMAVLKALYQLMESGEEDCVTGSCDTGTCSFGLTDITGVEYRRPDEETTIVLHGDGQCFCVQ